MSNGTSVHPIDISGPPWRTEASKVEKIGGNAERCSQPTGVPAVSRPAFMYMAAAEW